MPTDEPARAAASPSKKVKQSLNCAECRRLKLKCDREVPCSACVRRGCRGLCPDGVKQPRRSVVDVKATEQLNNRLALLENLLVDHSIPLPSPSPSSPNSHSHEAKRRRRFPPDTHSHSPRYPESRIRSPSPERYHASTSTAISAAREYPRPSSAVSQQHVPSPDRSFWDRQADYQSTYPPQPVHRSSGDLQSYEVGGDSPVEHSHGTLVIGSSGRSRYLGPTAGTEWLKNQERGQSGSPPAHSPNKADNALPQADANEPDPLYSFPFASPSGSQTIEGLLSHLPPKEDASLLVDCYYRYYAWLHDVAPRPSFQPLFDKLYASLAPTALHPQQLALVYMILAMGTLHNLELPPNDESADEYLSLAKGCLMKGDFLNENTIAGVRALITMGHYHLETEKGRNGDSAWPLWGLAMRIVVAMGLHRDGAKWNLPEEVVEERRQVFWECHTIEVFQANCFSRPSSLIPKYIDTAFPSNGSEGPDGTKTFSALTFELCQISSRILDVGMTVHHNPYTTVQDLYSQLITFERQVPFSLRCRVSLMSLPSVYPDPEDAKRASPEITRRQLPQTLQQYTIALNVSEQILHLQRPYFVMAMHDSPIDPTRSVYGHSYLAVVERCGVLVQIVASLYDLFPTISARHWFFWYHLFTAAVCLGTLILKNPSSVLASYALSQIDQAILVYSALIKQNNSPSMVENHDWLVRLRHRAGRKMEAAGANDGAGAEAAVNGGGSAGGSVNGDAGAEGEDVALLGWRTRLIERAPTGSHKAFNIHPKPPMMSRPSGSAGLDHTRGASGTEGLFSPRTQAMLGMNPSPHSHAQLAHTHVGPLGQIIPVPTMQQQVMQQHLVSDPMLLGIGAAAGTGVGVGASGSGGGTGAQRGSGIGIASGPGQNQGIGLDSSTDQLLHQFWDPMMMPDAAAARLASENWWSWDFGLDQSLPPSQGSSRPP